MYRFVKINLYVKLNLYASSTTTPKTLLWSLYDLYEELLVFVFHIDLENWNCY